MPKHRRVYFLTDDEGITLELASVAMHEAGVMAVRLALLALLRATPTREASRSLAPSRSTRPGDSPTGHSAPFLEG